MVRSLSERIAELLASSVLHPEAIVYWYVRRTDRNIFRSTQYLSSRLWGQTRFLAVDVCSIRLSQKVLFDSIELDRTTPQSRASLPASSIADHFFNFISFEKQAKYSKTLKKSFSSRHPTQHHPVCSRNIQHFNLHNTGTVVSHDENTHHATSTRRTSFGHTCVVSQNNDK